LESKVRSIINKFGEIPYNARSFIYGLKNDLPYISEIKSIERELVFCYESGVTPFFKIIFPYFAVSPVITTAKAFLALS